ncbi:MAG: ATP-binding cassette domain-containing protein [Clostridiales bacterium]|nr:ATP-binding cassette domain-containing protein [Clostridiales bacterium]
MANSIEVRNLTKKFYIFEKDYYIFKWLFTKQLKGIEKVALDNITLDVGSSEMVGVIGKNGAGKSTLMKLVAGITFPTSGTIETKGRIGSLINLSAGFNPDFTGRKNLYYKGMLMGMSREDIDDIMDDIIDFVDLGDYFDLPIRMYSSGMSARLGFALAVFSAPDILIVDEVFSVGDKNFQTKSKAKTTELFHAGKSVLFSAHSDKLIREFCNRVIYIKDGKIAFNGDVEDGLAMYNEDVERQGKK